MVSRLRSTAPSSVYRYAGSAAGGLAVLLAARLFALDLGQFVLRQTMPSVLACHRAAFEAIGGVPREISYDRIKTAVTGEDEDGRVVYNRTLAEFAKHYGHLPKACRAYREETKGKVSVRSATSGRTSSSAACSATWMT